MHEIKIVGCDWWDHFKELARLQHVPELHINENKFLSTNSLTKGASRGNGHLPLPSIKSN